MPCQIETMRTQKKTKPEETGDRKVQTYVSLTEDERIVVETLAERGGRTVSGQIRFLLRPLLVQRDQLNA